MPEVTLGQFISEAGAERDAVHVAVYPAVASGVLAPGVPVRLIRGNIALECERSDRRSVGIVDPFLKETVIRTGQMFWVFLYPNTVSGMRHHWSHPMFDRETPTDGLRERATEWLRDFARQTAMSVTEIVEEASTYDGCIYTGDNDVCSLDELADPEEFWTNIEIYTGQAFNADHRRSLGFRCGC